MTVIGAGNALGVNIPPYFVFKGKRMNRDLLASTAPGSDGCTSETGWSNSQIFKTYLTEHFMKYMQTGSNKSKQLLYDGHKSHIHPDIIEFARNHDITLFVLPPHTV